MNSLALNFCACCVIATSATCAPRLTGQTAPIGSFAATTATTGRKPQASGRVLHGWATWYSRASCVAESGQATMANGRPLDDTRLTCAMWLTNSAGRVLRPDGRLVTVRNTQTGRCLLVRWTDVGPGRGPRARGVIVDLSKAAMLALGGDAGLRAGRVRVTLETAGHAPATGEGK